MSAIIWLIGGLVAQFIALALHSKTNSPFALNLVVWILGAIVTAMYATSFGARARSEFKWTILALIPLIGAWFLPIEVGSEEIARSVHTGRLPFPWLPLLIGNIGVLIVGVLSAKMAPRAHQESGLDKAVAKLTDEELEQIRREVLADESLAPALRQSLEQGDVRQDPYWRPFLERHVRQQRLAPTFSTGDDQQVSET